MAAWPSGESLTVRNIAEDAIASLLVDSRCQLGESVVWCDRRDALFWTDIEACQLWMHTPATGETRQWSLPSKLGCLALTMDGRLLLGLAKALQVADVDAATDTVLPLAPVIEVETSNLDTRINDGRADRAGNFVFGTKSERDDGAEIGSFYQYSSQHGLRRLDLPHVAIPNSICFSLDGKTMYYCDSRRPRILCCYYDAENAAVSSRRTFIEVDAANASPDGSSIDAEGCLWNAQWGASRVVRYQPDGTTDRILAVPVTQPSCCVIGGTARDTLYISSARTELDEQALAREPSAGGIFQLMLDGALGVPESRVYLA